MEKITKGERTPQRVRVNGKRRPLSTMNLDPEFHHRVVNDVEDGQRIQEFLAAGYEIVSSKDAQVGEKSIAKAGEVREGTPVKISVGQGTKAYLMRIKKDWYQEDQAAKQRELDEKEATLKPEGTYGKIDMESPKARSKFA